MCYVENTTLYDIAYFICLLHATAVKYFCLIPVKIYLSCIQIPKKYFSAPRKQWIFGNFTWNKCIITSVWTHWTYLLCHHWTGFIQHSSSFPVSSVPLAQVNFKLHLLVKVLIVCKWKIWLFIPGSQEHPQSCLSLPKPRGCPHLPMAQDPISPPGMLHQGQSPPPHSLILPGHGPWTRISLALSLQPCLAMAEGQERSVPGRWHQTDFPGVSHTVSFFY